MKVSTFMANGRLSDRKMLLLFFVFAVAAVARFMLAHQSTLEWDEAQILAIAKLPSIAEIIRVVSIRELHPPLVEILLHGWIRLFGDTDAWVRNFTWFFGMLGLVATYLLARELSNSRKIALAVMGFSVFSPFLLHYSSITTFYSVYYALVVFSWYFLLRVFRINVIPQKSEATFIVVMYALTTWAAMYAHASAFLFLLFQGVYFVLRYRSLENKSRVITTGVLISALALLSPYLWLVRQPWHLSNTYHLDYQVAPFWSFLLSPINLLFLGYDLRDFHEFPNMFGTLVCSVIGFPLLIKGGKYLWAKNRDQFWLLFCLGIVPIAAIYLVSVLGQVGIFQFRTFFYVLFAFHYCIAMVAVDRPKRWCVLVTLFILFQLWVPWKRPYWPDTGNILAENVKAGFQPGDGIVFYPGWMSLVFLRYFDPEHFGLSEHERHFDPIKENYYTMVQRMDGRYFMVSGEKTWLRTDVKKAYARFERQHKRIWLVMENSPTFMSLLSCQNEYMVLTGNGKFIPQHCYRDTRKAD